MPGWSEGTVGYHVDDGKIFHAKNPVKVKEVEDAMAYRGDLIGCTIKFEGITNGQVPVVFTLNGRPITQDEIWIDYTPGGKPMYPYIAMGQEGMRVLAKMRPTGEIPDEQQSFRTITREIGSRSSDLEPFITMALDNVKEIKKTVDADYETFKMEMQEIRNHLNNAEEESQALESKLSNSFERLKNMFFFDDGQREEDLFVPDLQASYCEPTTIVSEHGRRLIETWELEAEEKERKVSTVVDLLRMILLELDDLGQKTKEKTQEILEELAQLKSEAQFQHFSLKSKNKGLDKNFLEVEELIQGCCTIKKIPLSTLEGSRN